MPFPTLADLDRRWVADSITGSDGAAISTVPDSSANSKSLAQATSTAQPTLKAAIVNGHAVMRFAKGDTLKESTCPNGWNADKTWYVVAKPTLGGDVQVMMGGGRDWPRSPTLGFDAYGSSADVAVFDPSNSTICSSTTTTAAWHVYTVTYIASTQTFTVYLDGTQIATGSGGNSGSAPGMALGAEYASSTSVPSPFAGDIAEAVVCSTAHDATDRASVHGYVQDTYAITVSDYPSGGTDHTATPGDDVGITDSATAHLATAPIDYTQTVTDPVGIADTGTDQSIGYSATKTETIDAADTASTTIDATRAAADPLNITDESSGQFGMGRGPVDTAGLSDEAAVILAAERIVADALGVTDTVTAVITSAGGASPVDDVGVTDAALVVAEAARVVADAIGGTDHVTAVLSAAAAAADGVGLTDSAVAVMQRAVTIADVVGVTDAASRPARNITVTATLAPRRWAATLEAQ